MLYLAKELDKISESRFSKHFKLAEEYSRILTGLIKTLKTFTITITKPFYK